MAATNRNETVRELLQKMAEIVAEMIEILDPEPDDQRKAPTNH